MLRIGSILALSGLALGGCTPETATSSSAQGDSNLGQEREQCEERLGETLIAGQYRCWVREASGETTITVRYCSTFHGINNFLFERTTIIKEPAPAPFSDTKHSSEPHKYCTDDNTYTKRDTS